MLQKPPECNGCPLHHRGSGWAPAVGSTDSLLCFVGEALGWTEAQRGEPFVGDAGVYLNRGFMRLGITRENVRIGNVVNCQPPGDWLVNAPWEDAAIAQCYAHRRQQIYHKRYKVYVTLGVTATRTVLRERLGIEYRGKLEDWHGYVLGDDASGYVVPTFHPAFLLRGQQKHFGSFLFDVSRAQETAHSGYHHDKVQCVEDPSPALFAQFVQSIPDDPDYWMACDIETPTKGTDEGDLAPGFSTSRITRISFATSPDQGWSIPFEPRYYDLVRAALQKRCAKIFHNHGYDVPILEANGFPCAGVILDSMWAWHMLQSDTKKGLGFVAPFYSNLPPWKHMNDTNPAYYSAMDSIQCLRIMLGVKKHLVRYGQWESYMTYATKVDSFALQPMTKVGVGMSREGLRTLEKSITERLQALKAEMTSMFPPHLIPPDGGWKRQPPKSSPFYHAAYLTKVDQKVLCCEDCGEEDVTPKHKCKEEKA